MFRMPRESELSIQHAELRERVAALDRLMEAKFVTMETLMRYQAEKVALALDASKEAINKADVADEKARDRLADDMKSRFAGVNELRGALEDSQRQNLSRSEFEVFRKAADDALNQMRTQHSEQLAELKGRLDKAEGKSGGLAGAWGIIVAVLGVGIGVGALLLQMMGN